MSAGEGSARNHGVMRRCLLLVQMRHLVLWSDYDNNSIWGYVGNLLMCFFFFFSFVKMGEVTLDFTSSTNHCSIVGHLCRAGLNSSYGLPPSPALSALSFLLPVSMRAPRQGQTCPETPQYFRKSEQTPTWKAPHSRGIKEGWACCMCMPTWLWGWSHRAMSTVRCISSAAQGFGTAIKAWVVLL